MKEELKKERHVEKVRIKGQKIVIVISIEINNEN